MRLRVQIQTVTVWDQEKNAKKEPASVVEQSTIDGEIEGLNLAFHHSAPR